MSEARIVNEWNFLRVQRMRDQGKSWVEIGKILAKERGRERPFLGASVQNSFNNWSAKQ